MQETHNNKALHELVKITSTPHRSLSTDALKTEPAKKFSSPDDIKSFRNKFNNLGKEIEKFENNNRRQDSTIAKNCRNFSKKFIQIGHEITSKSTSNLNLKSVLQSMQNIDKEILALDITQDARREEIQQQSLK